MQARFPWVLFWFIIGFWANGLLSYWFPEYRGLWIGVPFVAVYIAWNWTGWRDGVRLNREIREFQEGTRK